MNNEDGTSYGKGSLDIRRKGETGHQTENEEPIDLRCAL